MPRGPSNTSKPPRPPGPDDWPPSSERRPKPPGRPKPSERDEIGPNLG